MNNLEELIQGSEAWKLARCGKVTASKIGDVMAKIKSGEAAVRADYRTQIILERITGTPQDDGYVNDAMRWGTEQEPFARGAYEAHKGILVDQVGFIDHPSIRFSGASPDGLIGKDGLVEIKCPMSKTHLATLMAGEVPAKYRDYQIQWQLACAGRTWCDFVSYDPRFPAHMQMFVGRVERNVVRIAEIEAEVRQFLHEVDAALHRLGHAA